MGSPAASPVPSPSRSDIHIVRDYPQAVEKVWRALTDPALVPLWTATGRGGKPVGFAPVVGTKFRYVAKPMPGWSGVVEREVLEVREPFHTRFTGFGGFIVSRVLNPGATKDARRGLASRARRAG